MHPQPRQEGGAPGVISATRALLLPPLPPLRALALLARGRLIEAATLLAQPQLPPLLPRHPHIHILGPQQRRNHYALWAQGGQHMIAKAFSCTPAVLATGC